LFVEVKVIGAPAETIDRPVASDHARTLRALLTDLVSAEVAGYEQRRGAQQLLHVLTETAVGLGQSSGRIVSGGRVVPPAPPLEEAISRAVQAFADGLFYVFLDGQQLEDLDAPITMGPASRLRLVRLVALAGG
jgi:hypothetical protein